MVWYPSSLEPKVNVFTSHCIVVRKAPFPTTLCPFRFQLAPVDDMAMVPAKPVEEVIEYWSGEPSTSDELMDQYVVEAKFPAMAPGGTLFITPASNRSGETLNCIPNHRYKLWFVH